MITKMRASVVVTTLFQRRLTALPCLAKETMAQDAKSKKQDAKSGIPASGIPAKVLALAPLTQ